MAGHTVQTALLARSANEDAQMYQAYYSRGYLLADPHIHGFASRFVKIPEDLFRQRSILIAVSKRVIYLRRIY